MDQLIPTESMESYWHYSPINTHFPLQVDFEQFLPPLENYSSFIEPELSSNTPFCLVDESYFPPVENWSLCMLNSNGQKLDSPQTNNSGFSGNPLRASEVPISIEDLPTINQKQSLCELPNQEVTDHVVPDTTTSKKVAKRPRSRALRLGITILEDGSANYSCPKCDLTFPEKERLKDHLMSHNNGKNCFCDICGIVLKYYGHLARHMLSHKTVRPFGCEVCGKSFNRKDHLVLHSVIHSDLKRFQCEKCGKGFKRKDHLKKHKKTHLRQKLQANLDQGPLVIIF